jgi:O-antigen/teichoic acid export membrane protein
MDPKEQIDGEGNDQALEIGLGAAKSGSIFLGGEILTSIITLVLLVFLTRYLGPGQFGLYTIAISFAGILTVAQTFGIGTAYRKALPEASYRDKGKAAGFVAAGFRIALPVGLIIAIIGLLISGVVARYVYNNPLLTLALELAALSEFASVAFNLLLGSLVGLGKVKEATIANVGYSLGYLVAAVSLVVLGYGVMGAIAGFVIGLASGTILAFAYQARELGLKLHPADKSDIKRIRSFSLPIVVNNIAMQGSMNLAILVLGAVAISSAVGSYGAAYKLARFIELSITAITFILLGAYSMTLSKESTSQKINSIYNGSIYYTCLFLLPVVAYGIVEAAPLTNLLFSSRYVTAPLLFSVMIAGMAVQIIGIYAGTLMIGSGNTLKFMKYQLITIAMQIGLVFVLTPIYKVAGAVVALFVVSPILLDIIYIHALKKQFGIRHRFRPLAAILAASVSGGIVLYIATFASHTGLLSIVYNGIIGLLIFPAFLGIFGAAKRSNLEFIRSAGMRLKHFHFITDALVSYTSYFVREQK